MIMGRGREVGKSMTVVTAHDETCNDDGGFTLSFFVFLMLLIDERLQSIVIDVELG